MALTSPRTRREYQGHQNTAIAITVCANPGPRAATTAIAISVDGRTRLAARIGPLRELRVSLGRRGWHLVSFDAHLPKVGGTPVGARLIVYERS